MTVKELLAVNPPAKVAANIILLIASAYMSGSVLIFLPRELVPGRGIFAVLPIALEILAAFNLALALAEEKQNRRRLLFAGYFFQIAFGLFLHVLWGVSEIGYSERENSSVAVTVERSVDVIRQNDQTISNLQAVIGQESKTGFGDRYREALSNIGYLRAENERLASRAVAAPTNIRQISSDTFDRLHSYTGFPAGLAKTLVFVFLSLVMQYGLFLTAWTLPKAAEVRPSEVLTGGELVRKHASDFLRFVEAIYRDGSMAANGTAAISVATDLPAERIYQFREVMGKMSINGTPLLVIRQGGSTLSFPKKTVLELVNHYLKKQEG